MLGSQGFDLWANGYDLSVQLSDESSTYPFAGYRKVLNTIYQRIREAESHSVLDAGFGTGTLTNRLYQDGIAITGIDFSPEMIRIAGEKMPSARLICHDFSNGLPPELHGAAFDHIVCTYAIHHLTRVQKALFITQLMGILNPGGELLIGDVMFRTQAEQEACRTAASNDWDDDEIYIAVDELIADTEMPVEFIPCSACAGVCILKKT